MKISSVFLILFFHYASSLKAQLKEFEISEMPRPDVSIVQANTSFPEDALIIVYSSLDDLSFRSSMGAIDKQNYNSITSRYELLIKPIKQMLFVVKPGFLELKLNTLNPNAKDVIYFKVEEKTTALFNQFEPGKITINSNPSGANISLNGIPVETKTPFTGELNPGRTRIQLSKTKYQTFDTLMNIESSINEVLAINLKPSTLWLNITSNPTTAKVELDGVNIGTTPLSKELDLSDKSKQGPRLLKLTLRDYVQQTQTIQVYPSKDPLKVSMDLKKLEGTFLIESDPSGVEVFIDGVYFGQTPLQGSMPIGKYSVELKMEECIPSAPKQIIVNEKTQAKLNVKMQFRHKDADSIHTVIADSGLVQDASGNSYKIIKIGEQVWMAENLKTNRYSNGELIPNEQGKSAWAKLQTGAWCNYNNLAKNDVQYGKLYNWYAVTDYRNVCPVGWHVPSDSDWIILTDFLGGKEIAGGKLKTTKLEYWKNQNIKATNESGFSGFSGGGRDSDGGTFGNLGLFGYWWSSLEVDTFKAKALGLHFDNDMVEFYKSNKSAGISIRCLKD
jgi:uncharacterized protein (TIGR02145 family)